MDGLTAAWVALKWFSKGNQPADTIEFIGCNYGDDYEALGLPEKITGKIVFVLDFSFKRAIMDRYATLAQSFEVHDHHTTAQVECAGLPYCTFDLAHSGAYLAWKRFFPAEAVPEIVLYVEDRDLWKWALPNSKEINAVMQGYPKSFDNLDTINHRFLTNKESMINEGKLILEMEDRHIKGAIKYPILMRFVSNEPSKPSYIVPVINNPNLISQTVEALAKDQPFAAAFFLRQDGKFQFSLRSRKPLGIDVSQVAKFYDGGGHPAAAGFEIELAELKDLFVYCSTEGCHAKACYKLDGPDPLVNYRYCPKHNPNKKGD